MALIQSGSLEDFNFITRKNTDNGLHGGDALQSSITEKETIDVSTEERGLGLTSITLTKGFEEFLSNLFKAKNRIYLIAWAWDLSGQPICLYPGIGMSSEDFVFRVKKYQVCQFFGNGINLFPRRKVFGGIELRIHLWESDNSIRNFGRVMSEASQIIKDSELTRLLFSISKTTAVSGTFSSLEQASNVLNSSISDLLKKNSDDHLDYYEGYYPVSMNWKKEIQQFNQSASRMCIEKY
jgi:hypothetical protein